MLPSPNHSGYRIAAAALFPPLPLSMQLVLPHNTTNAHIPSYTSLYRTLFSTSYWFPPPPFWHSISSVEEADMKRTGI